MEGIPYFYGVSTWLPSSEALGRHLKRVSLLTEGHTRSGRILVRKRGALADLIMGELAKEGISYFNGLFSDATSEFIAFNALSFSRNC